MSYKIGVKTSGDHDWCYNSIRFSTEEEAKIYGRDLYWWTAVTDWEIHESDDAVNYNLIVEGNTAKLTFVGKEE